MAYRAPWDKENALAAQAMRESGIPDEEIASLMGRTVQGVRKAIFRHLGVKFERGVEKYYDGPAIGKDERYERILEDNRFASAMLREACLDLFSRTANHFNVSMDDAMACHLGYHAKAAIPGTERVRKSAEMQRLAA